MGVICDEYKLLSHAVTEAGVRKSLTDSLIVPGSNHPSTKLATTLIQLDLIEWITQSSDLSHGLSTSTTQWLTCSYTDLVI